MMSQWENPRRSRHRYRHRRPRHFQSKRYRRMEWQFPMMDALSGMSGAVLWEKRVLGVEEEKNRGNLGREDFHSDLRRRIESMKGMVMSRWDQGVLINLQHASRVCILQRKGMMDALLKMRENGGGCE